MPNSKLNASLIVLIKGQQWNDKVNPILVQALQYNLCQLMPTIARYLTNLGVPRAFHPDELIVMVHNGEDDNVRYDRTVVANTLDPKDSRMQGTPPLAALETIARMHMEGEELPDHQLFEQSADEMQMNLNECITLARKALGWKE